MGAEGLKSVSTTSDVPSTEQVISLDAAGSFVDRILAALADIRPTSTVEAACEALLDSVHFALPDTAIGVCVPRTDHGQIVVLRSSKPTQARAPDPARLFPEYRFERSIPILFDDGCTLHIASDDEGRIAAPEHLIDRLTQAFASAIRHIRTHERARSQTQEVRGLQAQVIQSEKLASLGQIAAGIVHELNNPLTSIVAYSDYLRKKAERTGGDPGDIERLMRINEAAERILRFSRDLIAYSRPATEVPAPVEINDVIERALVFCEHVLDETGVLVEKHLAEVPPVRGVAGQLTQVFVNLFTNAAHAMRQRGGCLSISTQTIGDGEVAITIVDDGHGIDQDHLPRIFEPFFTTKTDGSGTGLGLSIVRNIVLSHGGRIRADGREPQGTMFSVELPAAASPKSDR
jgi:two-component system, NtrC family, sensor kinase